MSKDDFLGVTGPLDHPQVIETHRGLIRNFAYGAHAISMVILQSLSSSLQLQPLNASQTSGDVLPNLHCIDKPSQDTVTFIKYPHLDPAPVTQPLASHTDYGSITLVFPDSPGLQLLVRTPDGERWQNIMPKPGHAVVNCGDALSLLTSNAVRSNIHRVASQVERMSTAPRYTIGYFARPLDDVRLKPMTGTFGIQQSGLETDDNTPPTTKEWVSRRYRSRLLKQYKGENAWEDTTGTEKRAMMTD